MEFIKKIWSDFKLACICVLVLFALILFILILSLFSSGKKSYESVEKIMETAAEKYFKDNKNLLPQNIGDVTNVTSETLSYSKYMNPLSEYRKGEECSGYVEVEKLENEDYYYQAYLTCGEEWSTRKFSEVISEIPLVTSGDGLYQLGNEKVFRGQFPKNYVEIELVPEEETTEKNKKTSNSTKNTNTTAKKKQLNSSIWRIVKIDAEDIVYLILDEPTNEDLTVWDDRFSVEKNNNSGINEYGGTNKNSRIYTFVNNAYDISISLHENLKQYTTEFDMCVGKRAEENITKNGAAECNMVLENQTIGILPLYEYMRASLDESCISTLDAQCQNYNYLVSKLNWWTLTGSSANTYQSYLIDTNGKIREENASKKATAKYVIALNKHVLYTTGTGTKTDPYKIKI